MFSFSREINVLFVHVPFRVLQSIDNILVDVQDVLEDIVLIGEMLVSNDLIVNEVISFL